MMIKNIVTKFNRGIVFVVEGNTERQFYEKLIEYVCNDNNLKYDKLHWDYNGKITNNLFEINHNKIKSLIYILDCTSGSRLPLQENEIVNIIDGYFNSKDNFGIVFICFDDETNKTRPYDENDIDSMITSLKQLGIKCIKIKANNTIEDIMLQSFDSIKKYLKLQSDISFSSIRGKTGKSKMQWLYQLANKRYHNAGEVSGLINILDMNLILNKEKQLQKIVELIKFNHNI